MQFRLNSSRYPIQFHAQLLFTFGLVQTDQLRKMSSRGIHFDLKEGHLEGHIALNEAWPAAGFAPSGPTIYIFSQLPLCYNVYQCIISFSCIYILPYGTCQIKER